MKSYKRFAVLVLCSAPVLAGAASFDDYARVLNVSERIENYNQPRQECAQGDTMGAPGERGVSGAVIGGVAGALLGSQVGRGNGQVAAAAVGAATGALVGDRVQNTGPGTYPVQRCRMVDNYISRVVGYTVSYEYQGKSYTDNVSFNPGDTMRVRVNVSPQR